MQDPEDIEPETPEAEEFLPTPPYVVRYYAVSGQRNTNCVFLAARYNEDWGFHVREGESWVASIFPQKQGNDTDLSVVLHLGTQGWYTGIWQSHDGQVFVSEISGRIYTHPNLHTQDARGQWTTELVPNSARGIWGLSSQCVYTWGERSGAGAVLTWDGQSWTDMPTPPFIPMSLHGLAPDRLWIGGARGAIANWDGAQWRVMPTQVDETISSLWAAAPDRIYAAGDGATILEGSPHGWMSIGTLPNAEPGQVYDIATWQDDLWVAAGPRGIWRRDGNSQRFEEVNNRADAQALEVRNDLVMACGEKLSGTSNGQDFFYSALNTVYEIREPFELGEF